MSCTVGASKCELHWLVFYVYLDLGGGLLGNSINALILMLERDFHLLGDELLFTSSCNIVISISKSYLFPH